MIFVISTCYILVSNDNTNNIIIMIGKDTSKKYLNTRYLIYVLIFINNVSYFSHVQFYQTIYIIL